MTPPGPRSKPDGMARKIIIDCDPGVDDATMLLLALCAPEELDIVGITVVAGNAGLGKTARNARLIRQIARRPDVPVFAGCARPMVRDAADANDFHGESGLGDLAIVEPEAPAHTWHAVDFLIRALRDAPEPITLVVTGPATNIAMALVMEPAIAANIAEFVVMGGARSAGGNITASAEFNIWADPHAAHVLLSSGLPTVMFGLDATYQVLTTPPRIAALEKIDTAAAQTSAALMRFSNSIEVDPSRRAGAPLHDPCTIAWLLKPELFTLRPARITVETGSPLTLGHTAVEFRVAPSEANARWCIAADGDGVFTLLNERLGRA